MSTGCTGFVEDVDKLSEKLDHINEGLAMVLPAPVADVPPVQPEISDGFIAFDLNHDLVDVGVQAEPAADVADRVVRSSVSSQTCRTSRPRRCRVNGRASQTPAGWLRPPWERVEFGVQCVVSQRDAASMTDEPSAMQAALGKRSLDMLVGEWEPIRAPTCGTIFEAQDTMLTGELAPAQVAVGMRGTVVEIDNEGDVIAYIPELVVAGLGDRRIILREDFPKLLGYARVRGRPT